LWQDHVQLACPPTLLAGSEQCTFADALLKGACAFKILATNPQDEKHQRDLGSNELTMRGIETLEGIVMMLTVVIPRLSDILVVEMQKRLSYKLEVCLELKLRGRGCCVCGGNLR
jgi:hypothetical protein